MTDSTPKPRYSRKAPTRGGARPGGGRPRGSTTRIRLEELIRAIELATGETYAERLAHNYAQAIDRADWAGVRDYDRAFMNKIVADRVDIEVSEGQDTLDLKRAAFAEAIAQIQQKTRPT